jgi:protocatechuate 3,4-dioxygenase beta subunit
MNSITKAILDEIDLNTPEERTKQVMKSLVRHLHSFVEEVNLTEEEWKKAIDFLTRTGKKCTETRQEFILLSDVLGVSILVDALNHDPEEFENGRATRHDPSSDPAAPKAPFPYTKSTILGPFYQDSTPQFENGTIITTAEEVAKGSPLIVDCQVVDGSTDIPVTNCQVNVWQASSEGLYDVQKTGINSETEPSPFDLRAILYANTMGRFWFYTVQPSSYPVPTDGPVGELLAAMGKHPYRPAHIHFQLHAPGFEPLTTHLFLAGDPYLKSDAVHAVKDSLVVGL